MAHPGRRLRLSCDLIFDLRLPRGRARHGRAGFEGFEGTGGGGLGRGRGQGQRLQRDGSRQVQGQNVRRRNTSPACVSCFHASKHGSSTLPCAPHLLHQERGHPSQHLTNRLSLPLLLVPNAEIGEAATRRDLAVLFSLFYFSERTETHFFFVSTTPITATALRRVAWLWLLFDSLHVLGALRLRRLTACRVVCGPVRGPIYVEGCKDCVVVAAGRQVGQSPPLV